MPTVLILGASSDMAVAIAKKMGSSGYNIQLAARNVARLQPLHSDLSIRYNISSTLHEFDAEKPEGHAAFFSALPTLPEGSVVIDVVGILVAIVGVADVLIAEHTPESAILLRHHRNQVIGAGLARLCQRCAIGPVARCGDDQRRPAGSRQQRQSECQGQSQQGEPREAHIYS